MPRKIKAFDPPDIHGIKETLTWNKFERICGFSKIQPSPEFYNSCIKAIDSGFEAARAQRERIKNSRNQKKIDDYRVKKGWGKIYYHGRPAKTLHARQKLSWQMILISCLAFAVQKYTGQSLNGQKYNPYEKTYYDPFTLFIEEIFLLLVNPKTEGKKYIAAYFKKIKQMKEKSSD